MTYWLAVIAALIEGAVITVQGAINGIGGGKMGTIPMVFGLSLVQAVSVAGGFWLSKSASIKPLWSLDWKWYAASGLLGTIGLTLSIFAIPRVGALKTFVLIILGQLVISVLVDQFGWFGMKQITVTPLRIVSVFIIAAGVLMLLKSNAPNA